MKILYYIPKYLYYWNSDYYISVLYMLPIFVFRTERLSKLPGTFIKLTVVYLSNLCRVKKNSVHFPQYCYILLRCSYCKQKRKTSFGWQEPYITNQLLLVLDNYEFAIAFCLTFINILYILPINVIYFDLFNYIIIPSQLWFRQESYNKEGIVLVVFWVISFQKLF